MSRSMKTRNNLNGLCNRFAQDSCLGTKIEYPTACLLFPL